MTVMGADEALRRLLDADGRLPMVRDGSSMERADGVLLALVYLDDTVEPTGRWVVRIAIDTTLMAPDGVDPREAIAYEVVHHIVSPPLDQVVTDLVGDA